MDPDETAAAPPPPPPAPAVGDGGDDRRSGGVPWWVVVLGALVLLGLGAGAIAAVASSSGDSAGGVRTTTRTTIGVDLPGSPGGAPPSGTGSSGSGGGSSAGGSGSSKGQGTTDEKLPEVKTASVNPDHAICPKFGGETTVTVDWATVNADYVLLQGQWDPPNGPYAGKAQGPKTIKIPCNGESHTLQVVPHLASGPANGVSRNVTVREALAESDPTPAPTSALPPYFVSVSRNPSTVSLICNGRSSTLVVFQYTTSNATSVSVFVSEPGKSPGKDTAPAQGSAVAAIPCQGAPITATVQLTPTNASLSGKTQSYTYAVFP